MIHYIALIGLVAAFMGIEGLVALAIGGICVAWRKAFRRSR